MYKNTAKTNWILRFAALLLFTGMTACMLLYGRLSAKLALNGLNLWFTKMIPALLPFMILSGILMETGLSDSFAALFSPILKPVFKLSDSCLYCIVIGFLCGFPMGARVCAQSYEKGKITRREATLLLAFCNNIGPVYFTGYVLALFPATTPWIVLCGMYAIPFLYGVVLRHTLYKDPPAKQLLSRPQSPEKALTVSAMLNALHKSILSGLDAITVLGGYMIFCNLLTLLPSLLLKNQPHLAALLTPLFEITSGLSALSATDKFWAYTVLPFGGLSCIAQTYSCINSTDLSLMEYIFHKVVQTMLTAAFYSFFLMLV